MTLVKNRIKKAFSAEAEKAFYMFKILKGQDNREPEYVQVPGKD